VPSLKEWIAIGAFVAFVLIPICWRFWRRWDRPSKAAVSEMLRRIRERDIREAFIREDAKLREQQRLEAERELSMRKAQAPAPVEKSTLASAFGNLGAVDSTGTAVLESSPTPPPQTLVAPVENVDQLVDSLEIDDILEDVIPEAAPVAVQIHQESITDEDDSWVAQEGDDEWSGVDW
jgi:hypothetical protein|tara:strand:- start:188 stop:721 length:534 start_codon:yes stop_codon:yes gene_type:complete